MRSIAIPAGAPLLVIFYVVNLFLTNFGLPMYLAYSLFLLYGSVYIFSRLYSGHGIKLTDKRIFFLHFLLLVYVITMYSFYAGGLLFRENIYWWNQDSTLKFLSILIASIAVIMTPIGNIVKSLAIIKNISYLLILGAFFYYLLTPFGLNFFASDALAGYRFNGGINSYIIAGQLLLAGFIAHFQLSKNTRPRRVFMALVLFGAAIFATKDRTTVVSMFIILAILFYRTGFGMSPFLFRMRKSIVLVILVPVSVAFFAIQFQQITSGNIDAYKSTLNRVVLSIRSYDLFKHTFPLGAGPGSQTYLMYDQKIDVSMYDDNNQGNLLQENLVKEIKNWEQRVGSGESSSVHNTYFEYLVPYGALGLLFVISIWIIQLGSLKRLFFRKGNSTIFLDSFAVSSMLFFIFSSLSHLIWLYLIYYRMLRYQKIRSIA